MPQKRAGPTDENLAPVSFRAPSLGDGDDKLRWKAIAPDPRSTVCVPSVVMLGFVYRGVRGNLWPDHSEGCNK